MATISIADNDARIQHSIGSGGNTAGGTQFTIDYPFFSLDDINVTITNSAGADTALSRGTGTNTFSVAGTAVDDGFSGGYIILNTQYTSSTVTITRDIPISRTSDFATSGPFNISSLNTELDKIYAVMQQIETNNDRSLTMPDSDALTAITLPGQTSRLGTVLGFNASTGQAEVGPTIANVNALSAITANINTVGGIASNVTTVAGIQANVSTVAGISSNVSSVAGNATNINTVAGKASLITSDFASDMALIDSTFVSKINLVTSDFVTDMAVVTSDFISDLNSLATTAIIADLDLLATSDFISDLNAVEGIKANVTTVAGISSNVTSVAGNASNITSAVSNASNINSAVSNASNINSAVSNASNINSAVSNASNINAVAGAITNVNNVGGAITNINTVASNVAGVNSFAERYRIASSAPSSSLNVGDLYFDTGTNTLKVYKSSGWADAGSSVNGTSARFHYDISGTPTTVTGSDANSNTLAYDAGFLDVYVNGVRMSPADITTTSGSSVVFASALADGDEVDIVTFGVFSVANIVSTGALNSGSITSGFGTINTGSSSITTTGVGSFGSLDISGDIDVDGTTNLDVTDIDGTLNVQGETTLQTHLNMGDEDKIKLGASGDLEIYHDGNNSFIKDTGTGNLYLQASDSVFITNASGNKNKARFDTDGAVTLYHNNDAKIATASGGVTVTGNVNFANVNSYITGGGHNIVQVDSTKTYLYGGTGGVQVRTADNASGIVDITNAGAVTVANGLTLTDGNLVVASGHGIDFSAHNNAGGMSSELLDHYEEGTSTISIGSGGGMAGTWSSAIGRYTKVGRKVTLQIDINGSGMRFTSTAGYVVISGVPFAALQGTGTQNYSGSWSGNSVGVSSGGSVYLNATSLYLHASNSGQASAGVSGIGVSITYFTAS